MEPAKSLGRERMFRAGEVIFAQGEAANEMYRVLEGSVHLRRQYASGQRDLPAVGCGEFFGEMGLLQGHQRTASAIAGLDTRLHCLDRTELELTLRQDPYFVLELLLSLCERLGETNKFLDEVLDVEVATWTQLEDVVNHIHSIISAGKPR